MNKRSLKHAKIQAAAPLRDNGKHGDVDTITRKRPGQTHHPERMTQDPKQYKVLIHNDDYTPDILVIDILIDIFGKDRSEALHATLTVHYTGMVVAGIYSRDIAETKVEEATKYARGQDAPLMITMEEVR